MWVPRGSLAAPGSRVHLWLAARPAGAGWCRLARETARFPPLPWLPPTGSPWHLASTNQSQSPRSLSRVDLNQPCCHHPASGQSERQAGPDRGARETDLLLGEAAKSRCKGRWIQGGEYSVPRVGPFGQQSTTSRNNTLRATWRGRKALTAQRRTQTAGAGAISPSRRTHCRYICLHNLSSSSLLEVFWLSRS